MEAIRPSVDTRAAMPPLQQAAAAPRRLRYRVALGPALVDWLRAHALLFVAASVGAVLLIAIAATRWAIPGDEVAYWLAAQHFAAGQPLYNPAASPIAHGAYWYAPVMAQVLAPIASAIPAEAFRALWTALIVGCLWWLSGRRIVLMLALVAFPPVAEELMWRNVHLILAVLIVLAVTRSWLFWVAAAAIKLSPALGVVYLVSARRYREAALTVLVGLAVLAVSAAISPDSWRTFLEVLVLRAGGGEGLLPIPYATRLLAGLGLVIVAGRTSGRASWAWLVAGLTVANPTLWANGLSLLVAAVPLLWGPMPRTEARRQGPRVQARTTQELSTDLTPAGAAGG